MMEGDEYILERLRSIAASVDDRRGWDFSRMQTEREPVPWDYLEVVRSYLKPTHAVLDIGTGGGEKFLALSPRFATGVGIDPDPDIVRVARANGAGQPSVTFAEMSAEDLAFAEATFDVVLCRHAPFVVAKVIRVLKPGGYLVTQQVGAGNMANIRQEFSPRPEQQRVASPALLDDDHRARVEELSSSGCRILATGAYDVAYWVKDIPSLIFWLQAIAGGREVPAGFTIDRDWQTVNRIITRYATAAGVRTNEHRTLLVARKGTASGPSA